MADKIIRVRIPTLEYGRADFRLGLGRCGKEVIGFDADAGSSAAFFAFRQLHSDGTSKVFLYPVHTINGRVEIEYGDE